MGRCGLESGDAVRRSRVRKLNESAAQPFHRATGGLAMRRNEPGDNKIRHALPTVHPNAAAIDVGARMHVAAVAADRTAEPVRSFGTFTTDLHRLGGLFAECGGLKGGIGATRVFWVPGF